MSIQMSPSASSRSLASVQSHAESVRDAIVDDEATLLTDEEIKEFLDDLDHNNDGQISYKEIEAKLDQIHDEIAPNPLPHHLHHDSKEDQARHEFLRSLIGVDSGSISREDMARRIKGWGIPSTKQETEGEEADAEYLRRFTWVRRFRSYWSVRGPEITFIALVTIMILAFCLWQLIKYITQTQYRAAFGWGIVLAKASAGAIYPTFFFVLLSMSRYFSTFLRRWYHISRFINWDLSQRFHIAVSCLLIVLATLHAIGHLSGTFVYGSRLNREPAVNNVINGALGAQPHYIDYIRSLPGITGLVAFGLLYALAILSMPQVRRWNYEVFQLGHLLMYPIIGLLCAHGSAALLQQPMLGYFMAFPALLVVIERVVRVLVGFRPLPATIRKLDSETVEIKVDIPGEIIWKYRPGQWVFLQVPTLSRFQWHPFTISVCLERQVQLHIKTDGNWTKRLRDLVPEGKSEGPLDIGLNGPFGAPAERFYDFSHTLLIGAGIGVTPFSGILADLQAKDNRIHGGPRDFEVGRVHPDDADKPDQIRSSRSTTSVNTITHGKPKGQKRREYNEKPMAGQPISAKGKQQKKKKSRDDSNDLTLTRSLTQSLSRCISRARSRMGSRRPSRQNSTTGAPIFADDYRRVDFHWMVRDKNSLGWFSNLLNTISRSQIWHRSHDENAFPHLDIRLSTHVTQKRKAIVTHIYRWLLELHRTDEHPESPLTGLINPTHYGRPDFTKILDRHYDDMVRFRQETGDEGEKLKVGVFFCGAPLVGEILADQCRLLTNRGVVEGTNIRYHFMIEVFG